MGSILECSTELGSVHSESEIQTFHLNCGIILDWRCIVVLCPVNKSSVGSIAIGTKVSIADVVADTQHAIAVIRGNAAQLIGGWNCPVVVVLESSLSVSIVILS
jgi:hypothetical protein